MARRYKARKGAAKRWGKEPPEPDHERFLAGLEKLGYDMTPIRRFMEHKKAWNAR